MAIELQHGMLGEEKVQKTRNNKGRVEEDSSPMDNEQSETKGQRRERIVESVNAKAAKTVRNVCL